MPKEKSSNHILPAACNGHKDKLDQEGHVFPVGLCNRSLLWHLLVMPWSSYMRLVRYGLRNWSVYDFPSIIIIITINHNHNIILHYPPTPHTVWGLLPGELFIGWPSPFTEKPLCNLTIGPCGFVWTSGTVPDRILMVNHNVSWLHLIFRHAQISIVISIH